MMDILTLKMSALILFHT